MVRSTGDGFDEAVANCVASVLSMIRFPESPDRVTLDASFEFHDEDVLGGEREARLESVVGYEWIKAGSR